MSGPNNSTPNTSGFTLMELLLVLAILTVIVALAWPSVQRSFEDAEFRDAAKQVRIELAETRLEAIRAGATRVFRFRGGTGEFLVSGLDSSGETEERSASPRANSQPQVLPHGVRFQGQQTEDTLAEELTGDSFDVGSSGSLSSSTAGGWSDPIVFFANGRTSTVRIRLVDHRGYRLDVTLRGLTGSARVGRQMKPDQHLAEEFK